ncbi:hypothetical protein QQX98_000687 [Neonectria punicea]|uniref:Carrier domain-containing protein n=1 Tax=Neonectria punicea TaxID=979145 RepID=A0ABR1HS90_9HYPO
MKASWALLLHRYTDYPVVTFGVFEEAFTAAGRKSDSSVAHVEQWEVSPSLDVMVRCLHAQAWVADASIERKAFNTCVSVRERRTRSSSSDGKLCVDEDTMDRSLVHNCDLVVGVLCDPAGLRLSLEYATELLSLFAHIFKNQVLSGTTQMDMKSLSDSNLGAISMWNTRAEDRTPRQCIHTVVQERCHQTPHAPAVYSWDGSLTYTELNFLAERLQAHLQRLGIGAESVVAMYMERSTWVAVSLLGVLRAGGAFLLLDTSYPLGRVADMCREVKARIILTSRALIDRARDLAEVVLIPSELNTETEAPPFEAKVGPENAAYLAFTSGSTGVPKGIVIEHRCFFAGALTHAKALAMDQGSRVLHFASYGFDVSILDLLAPLALGGCVCIPSERQRLDNLPQAVSNLGVTWAFLTPSVARRIDPDTVPQLRTLILGGEPMLPADMETWSHKVRLGVGYGPAECAVLCTAQPEVRASSVTNIGHPYGGSAWIVSPTDHQRLQPIGAVGELVISGPAVGRGYLLKNIGKDNAFLQRRPSWAMSLKLPSNERFYKTGDLVRYEGDDGTLCYLGRKDRQVKIHGQRVELQEVEHQAQQVHAGITTAAEVLDRPETQECVLALFVRIEGDLLDTTGNGFSRSPLASLQEQLRERLPRFMVPSVYIPLRDLPLATTGKLDRKALRRIGDRFLHSQSQGRACYGVEEDERVDDEDDADEAIQDVLRRVYARVLGLRQAQIGANDEFLALGGSSMTAIDLVAKARESGLSVSVADVLTLQTCAKLAAVVRACEPARDPTRFELASNVDECVRVASAQSGIHADSIEDLYPCSPLQAGLMSLSSRHSGLMVATYAFHLPLSIDLRRFQRAWNAVVANTPILRTCIIQLDSNELVQAVVARNDGPPWEVGSCLEEVVGRLEAKDMAPGLPLAHFGLVSSDDGVSSFVLTIHHAAMDGWSYHQFWDDLQTAYCQKPLSRRPSFSRYIRYISQQESALSMRFWTREFRGLRAVTFPAPPAGWEAPTRPSVHRLEKAVTVPASDGSKPWASIIRLAWALVVANITHTNDVVFGTTVSGRSAPVPGIDRISGPTIATYPLRVQLEPSTSVRDALREMRERDAARIEFEHTGLQAIRQFSQEAEIAVGFQTLLTIQPQKYCREPPILVDLPQNHHQQIKFNTHILSIIAQMTTDSIILEAVFDESVIHSDKIQAIFDRFAHVIREVANQPDLALGSINMMTKDDQRRLQAWNKPRIEPKPECMHHLIVAAGRRCPAAEAVCAWDGTLNYDKLLRLSHSVTGYLQSLNVTPETVIAVHMERCRWLPVATLGVLLTGAAFLLLDPKLPAQRLRDICKDANVGIALTTDTLLLRSKDVLPAEVLAVSTEKAAANDSPWTLVSVSPSNLMYVMFTSGTTGGPKGVLIEHGMCWSTFSAYKSGLPITSSVRMLFLAPMSFDIAVLQLLFPLAAGGCVCIPSEDDCLSDLTGVVTRQRANWLATTPSVARTLKPADVPGLKTLELGGEPMLPSDVATWADDVDLWTSYGPAECAIMVTSGSVSRQSSRSVGYIGHALSGCCWIVNANDHHQLQPNGTVGELLVSGLAVARGYLNKPGQTDQSFIGPPRWTCDFPFAQQSRFYKTGDLVYYDTDGSLQYVGRKDHQIKHHGQRIELAEIEHCARKHNCKLGVVADLIVLADPHGARLVLFVCDTTATKDGRGAHDRPLIAGSDCPPRQGLRRHLEQNLPGFMVPSMIISVEYLPISQNGKLDRRRLRAEASRLNCTTLQRLVASPSKKRAPSTEQESIVRGIFARVLGLDDAALGVDDSFFALGGDSITAMRLLSLCREANIALEMAELLAHKSVAGVCQHARAVTSHSTKVMPEVPGRPFPLSPIQQMFLDHTPSIDMRFNQSFFVKVNSRSITSWNDIPCFGAALFALPTANPGRLCSRVARDHFVFFSSVSTRGEVETIAEQAHANVSIVNGPQFSLDIVRVRGEGQYALFVAHHMVVDLVSWRIILDDVERLLSSTISPQKHPLPFQHWVQRQIEYSQDVERPLHLLPVDVRPANYGYWDITPQQNTFGNASRIGFALDQAATSALLDQANGALDTKPQEIFQAALLYAWENVFPDRETPTLFTEGHGRQPWEENMDLSNTVGWFSIAWPCTIEDKPATTFSEVLYQVKAAGRAIPNNGLPYFSARYLNPTCRQGLGHHSCMEVLFNYKGQYQQLNRQGAAFSQATWVPDAGMDISPDMPRFAVFDVEVDVIDKCLHVSIWVCDSSSRKADIARWAVQYEKALHLASQELPAQSTLLPLINIQLFGISLSTAQALSSGITKRLSLTSTTLLEDIYPACTSHAGLLYGLTGRAGNHSGIDGQVMIRLESSNAMIDGTSISLILRDFCGAIDGQMSPVKPPLYRTYVEHVSQIPMVPVDTYWEKVLTGARCCLFPPHTEPPSSPEMRTTHRNINNPELIHDFWRLHGLTLTNLLQLAWAMVLRRYTGGSDISFGTLVAGRDDDITDIWQIVGPCINILPCRIQMQDDLVLLDVLKRNQVDMQQRVDHQNCSLPLVVGMSELYHEVPFNTCLTVQPSLSGMSGSTQDGTTTLRLVEHHDPTEVKSSVFYKRNR